VAGRDGRTLFDHLIELRDRQRAALETSMKVVRGRDLPEEVNPLGRMRWYLHPSLEDRAVYSLIVATHELRPGEASGRLRFQGGSIIFYLQGRGRTVLDGVAYDWKAEDCMNVPLRPDGVIIQHFNTGTETARFVEASPNLVHTLGVDRGSGFDVLEPAHLEGGAG
jgi:gentisate 1,2-dioxygenase